MVARTLMIQGTASSVGKSLLVAALCRLFRQDGWRVAPFKSQNMALNSFVTREGGEMGRAQVVQAVAAGLAPHVDMNPILLKPEADHRSQVVVLGRSRGSMGFRAYRDLRDELLGEVEGALGRLRATNDLVVIEGAGSPAEINLRAGEIVNMRIARLAEAPVILTGDIDRGGVFAHLVGTLELLEPDERQRIKGFFINKFRGDVTLLRPGLDFLEQRTGVPVLGVIPYFRDLRIPEEDSVALEAIIRRVQGGAAGAAAGDASEEDGSGARVVDVAVIALPHISNFDDFDPLAREPGVTVRYVESTDQFGQPDLVVLPGTKTTLDDLRWLRTRGLDRAIRGVVARGAAAIGICGGYQMLGERVDDPGGAESAAGDAVDGLGLLPVRTIFESVKATHQVTAAVADARGLLAQCAGTTVTGYEIHMGRSEPTSLASNPGRPAFTVSERAGAKLVAHGAGDGMLDAEGRVLGTYLHGLFDNGPLRRSVLRAVAAAAGRAAAADQLPWGEGISLDDELDRLAGIVRQNVDLPRLYAIAGLQLRS